jgi:hypothetical protein
MSITKRILAAGAASAALLLSTAAFADGIVIATSKVAPAARTSLSKDIAAAKRDHATVRAKVRDVQGVKKEVYGKRQNPIPYAAGELRALGKDALVPMLESLAFDASQPGLDAREKEALAVGMLSAVGDIRDARSTSVVSAIFEAETGSTPIAIAAATALGKRCDATELKLLETHSAEGDKLRLAAIEGLGECRRKDGAKKLASILASADDQATQAATVRSLGVVGSSWAWVALGKDQEQKGIEVRTMASDALLSFFVKNTSLRTETRRAFLKCEAPNALEQIQSAKRGADASTVKALEEIEARLAKRAARK